MKSEPESRFENGVDVKVRPWRPPALPRGRKPLTHGSGSFQFGIEDLKAMSDQTSCWDGVRNFQVGELNQKLPETPLRHFFFLFLFNAWC